MKSAESEAASSTFLARNEFLLRRLHSLSGMIPIGAYMVIHLLTNATVLDSPAAFQKNVYAIHSLGVLLPLIEWVFIFIPILFHAIYGVLIIRGSVPNNSSYKYTNNIRYTLQRATGMIAFAFIVWHVFHMHGWFHADAWMHRVAAPLGGAMFRPFNAASTGAEAMRASMPLIPILYAIGVLSCVFHLANGIWTFGITWGIWVTPASQRWATVACLIFGLGLSAVGLGALGGFTFGVNVQEARRVEEKMLEQRVAAGELNPEQVRHKSAKKSPTPAQAQAHP